MNRPIRRVAIIAAIMFAALLINATYIDVFRSPGMATDTRNRRVRDAEYARERGAILVGNTPVAITKPNPGRFAFARTYPNSPVMYAPVTGFYAYDFGSAGVELKYSQALAGTDDSQAISRLIDMLSGKAPKGATAHTTINAKAQQAAWEGLDGRKGAVVALNYKTGAVLSYVSYPSYDPNSISSTDLTKASAAWKSLLDDPNKPLANRAGREIYPPGSTFKLVTAAAALEAGMTPETEVDSPKTMKLPQTNIELPNDNGADCGGAKSTITHALDISCNTAFANIGLTLGAEKLQAQAEKFGFNTKYDTDVPMVVSKFPTTLNQPQLAMSSIGQYEVAASPLQIAMVAAGIANDGVLMEPYIVQEIRSADLQLVSSHRPTKLSEPMSAKNAKLLQQMMVSVVQNGSGKRAQIDGVVVGGKTGTAQSSPQRPPYAWFVAFSQNPDVAVAVFIEDAGVDKSEIAGGRLAAPIAKAVIEALR